MYIYIYTYKSYSYHRYQSFTRHYIQIAFLLNVSYGASVDHRFFAAFGHSLSREVVLDAGAADHRKTCGPKKTCFFGP